MSTDQTQTADQINAAQALARTAQASAIASESNGGGSTAAKPARKRRSAAQRKSDALSVPKGATPAKGRTAPKPAAPARIARPVKPAGPSDRTLKASVAQFALTTAVNAFAKLPSKTVKGVKYVTLNGVDIPRDTALYAVKQTFGYVPPSVWDKRLGARDVGRPVATPKVTPAPAPAKRSASRSSAPKSSAPKSSAPKSSAPKSSAA